MHSLRVSAAELFGQGRSQFPSAISTCRWIVCGCGAPHLVSAVSSQSRPLITTGVVHASGEYSAIRRAYGDCDVKCLLANSRRVLPVFCLLHFNPVVRTLCPYGQPAYQGVSRRAPHRNDFLFIALAMYSEKAVFQFRLSSRALHSSDPRIPEPYSISRMARAEG
jgi:hypothetical protein